MAVLNSSFEDGGARPGEAAHWTLVTHEVEDPFGDISARSLG